VGSETQLVFGGADRELHSCIRAILDDDPQRCGARISGHVVHPAGDYAPEGVQRVVITSQMHEAQLTRRAEQLFGPNADIVYTFDRGRSLPSVLNATCDRIDRSWREPHAEDALWYCADRLYTSLRKRLNALPTWRYGAHRQLEEFAQIQQHLRGRMGWRGVSLLNFGCGRYHPFGISLLALLARARRTSACDLEPITDPARGAQATLDLITEVLADPRSGLGADAPTRAELVKRLEAVVELDRLQRGDLLGAVRPRALDYRVESIYDTSLPRQAFDLIVSRDVFEHLPDVPNALAILHDRLRPEGIMFLAIDFSDHRRYQNPRQYFHWSHLLDIDEPTHMDTNRLRFPQYRALFEQAGFDTLDYEAQAVEPLPFGAKASLAPIYRRMADSDLAVSRAVAVLRRPHGQARRVRAASGASLAIEP
jgi:SAM-dependent methyltransferase